MALRVVLIFAALCLLAASARGDGLYAIGQSYLSLEECRNHTNPAIPGLVVPDGVCSSTWKGKDSRVVELCNSSLTVVDREYGEAPNCLGVFSQHTFSQLKCNRPRPPGDGKNSLSVPRWAREARDANEVIYVSMICAPTFFGEYAKTVPVALALSVADLIGGPAKLQKCSVSLLHEGCSGLWKAVEVACQTMKDLKDPSCTDPILKFSNICCKPLRLFPK